MEEGELLQIADKDGLGLGRIMIAEGRAPDQLKPILLENLCDLAKGHQVLGLGLLKGLQLHSNGPPKVLRPSLTVRILLGDLSKDLPRSAKHHARLAQKERVDELTIHAGSDEHSCAHAGQVAHKRPKGLLGLAGIVHRHLARDDIKLCQPHKLLEILGRRRFPLVHHLEIAVVLLQEGLGHVRLDKEGGRHRALGHLLQVAHARSLTGSLNVPPAEVNSYNLAGLGLAPLVEIVGPSHTQFQQGIPLPHGSAVELLLDAVVKPHQIGHDAIPRLESIAVVELILEGIVGRTGRHRPQHGLRDRHVHVRPDVLGHMDVVSILSQTQHTVLVGLVVASPHDHPAPRVDVPGTLDDRIGLHPNPVDVLGSSCASNRNLNLVRIRSLGRGRLEGRGHTIPRLGLNPQLRGHHDGTVLARQRLAGVDDVRARRASHKQRALAGADPQGRVVGFGRSKGHQEVN